VQFNLWTSKFCFLRKSCIVTELNDRNIHLDSVDGSVWMHVDYSVEKKLQSLDGWRYSSCGTWWYTRRNQISSFPETEDSI